MGEDCAVSLDASATGNPVFFRRLTHRNSPLGKMGLPRVATYLAQARFKFRRGGMGDVRSAADITAGIAPVSDANTPAFLRKGALEAPGGQLDFFRDTLTLGFSTGGDSPQGQRYGTLYFERRGF